MRQMPKIRFGLATPAVLAAVVAFAPVTASTQIADRSAGFQSVRVAAVGDGYRYAYRLRHDGNEEDIWSNILLDLSMPRLLSRPPEHSVGGGRFLWNAVAKMYDEIEQSHSPVRIWTGDEHWSASMRWNGELSWGADRWGGGDANFGLRHGAELSGFALFSEALPSFRRFAIVPWRPFPTTDRLDQPEVEDSTWLIHRGYVVAPGWLAEDVNGHYLLEQVHGACWSGAIRGCEAYRTIAGRIIQAENEFDDEVYRAQLRRAFDRLRSDEGLTRTGRMVLEPTIRAMARPDRRPTARGGEDGS